MNIEKTKKRNTTLNFFEIIACITVILSHTGFPKIFEVIGDSIVRFGVPLFYVVAGFFLVDNEITKEKLRTKLVRKIIHICRLIIFAVILYCLVYLILNINTLVDFIQKTFTIRSIAIFFGFNFPFLNGASWFLFAMLYAYVFIYVLAGLFLKNKKLPYILSVCTVLMYTIAIVLKILKISICGVYLYENIFVFRNWYGVAIPFISLGIIIKYNACLLQKIRNRVAIIGFVIGMLLSFAETYLFKKIGISLPEFLLGGIVCVVFAIVYSYNNPNLFHNNKFVNFEGNWTMYVYIIHPAFVLFMDKVIKINEMSVDIFTWIKAPIVIVVSVSFSILINKIVNRIKRKKQKTEC